MEEVERLFSSKFSEYFPKPTDRDWKLFNSLPDEFCLDVPYVRQNTPTGSGSACLEMLGRFHSLEVGAQLSRAQALESNWELFNHETLAEDFTRLSLEAGLLPYTYYPGRFVLPKFDPGYLGADFIAANLDIVSPFDRVLMKAAIFGSKVPLFVRIHFATDEYKMTDEMAKIVDTAGHALLLCGWNAEGFLCHDPWDGAKLGGFGGGAYRMLTYKRLTEMKPLVNCCLEQSDPKQRIKGFIRAWDVAVYEGREMDVVFQLEAPELPSYYYDYVDWNYSFKIDCDPAISVLSVPADCPSSDLTANGKYLAAWRIKCPPVAGSYRLDVQVTASGIYPVFAWESAARAPQSFAVTEAFHSRLDVKRLEWLNNYARQ